MAYSEEVLVEKLRKMTDTAESISQVSLWMIFHHRHCDHSVKTWDMELRKSSSNNKLTFLHLCNDVIQNSRKKGPEFLDSFASVLPGAMEHAFKRSPYEVRKKIDRILGIWEERELYPKGFLADIRATFVQSSSELKSPTTERPSVVPDFSKLGELIANLASSTPGDETNFEFILQTIESDQTFTPSELLARLESYQSSINRRISTREQALRIIKALANQHEKLLRIDRDRVEVISEKLRTIRNPEAKRRDSSEFSGMDGAAVKKRRTSQSTGLENLEIRSPDRSSQQDSHSPPSGFASTPAPRTTTTTSDYNLKHPLPTPRQIPKSLRRLSLSLPNSTSSQPPPRQKLSIPSPSEAEEDEGVHMVTIPGDVW